MKKSNLWNVVMIFFTLTAMVGCAGQAFNKAKEVNTVAAYDNFLKKYPDHKLAKEARDRIEDITWEDIRIKNQTPTKPSVDPSAKKTCYFSGPRRLSKICSQPTSDGGKLCTSSKECQGSCLSSDFRYVHGGQGREGRRIGKCSNVTDIGGGCIDFIQDGYVRGICSD